MALRRIVVSLGLTAVLLGCVSSAGAEDAAPLRVLFVGNSLTATNDLPGRVAGLAAATGRRLEYEEITFGGFSLEDHWNQGDARTALATGRWNVVIMQQGPSALPESQVDLRLWTGRFADEARAVRNPAGSADRLAGELPEAGAFGRDRLLPERRRGGGCAALSRR